jgi:hypothetical protein
LSFEQATLGTVPAFHADRVAAADDAIDGGGAVFGSHRRERPSGRVQHAQAALAIEDESRVAGPGISTSRNLQNLFGPAEEFAHKLLIGERGDSFLET